MDIKRCVMIMNSGCPYRILIHIYNLLIIFAYIRLIYHYNITLILMINNGYKVLFFSLLYHFICIISIITSVDNNMRVDPLRKTLITRIKT
jgi:hypothetical protein